MTFLRRTFLNTCFVASLLLVAPLSGFAQVDLDSFSLTWNGSPVSQLVQGDCYDLNAGPNAAGVTLDILWSLNGVDQWPITGWPTLDGNGQAANICTGPDTTAGTRTFVAVRDSSWPSGHWSYPNYGLTMLQNATGASFDQSQGYAGTDSYTFSVGGAANTAVRIRFDHDYYYNQEGLIWVDLSGNYWSGILDHYSYLGHYVITGVQLAEAQPGNYTGVYAPYDLLPPQPQSLSASPGAVYGGATDGSQRYRLSAANGGGMSLSLRYGIRNNGQWVWGSESDWPYLYETGRRGWDGISGYISTGNCTRTGDYYFYQVKNSLHGEEGWINTNAWLTVNGSGLPTVSSFSPASANRGQSASVTIYGQRLCGIPQLQTIYPGLSFSNISNGDSQDGTSFTATFTIAANAAPGNAPVTMTVRGVSKTFYFGILQSGGALPTISAVAPSSAPPGSTVTVTMTGANLIGPVLSTTWTGLTFSEVAPNTNGTSLTAKFTLSGSAATGTPPIKVTTSAGFVTTSKFAIGSFAPALSREYIYFGDRLIAAESP